jgi:formylglycine-generating enzyme required for sulfatase activity
VDDSDVVIVCLSNQSLGKEGFVQREIRYAYDLALEKPEETIFLIPLRLDDCDVPRKLRSLHWVDYFGPGKKHAFSDLLAALKLRYDQKLGMEDEQVQQEPGKGPSEQVPDVDLKKKFTQRKPYTKILDPSSLNPSTARKDKAPKLEYRRVGIAGIVLLLFILGGFGLNALLDKPPDATLAPTLQVFTETSKPPTETSIPFTPTLTEAPSPSPTSTTVLGIGSTSKSLKDEMVLVFVPAGEFTMGSDGGDADNRPAHQVYLDAFWIDRTEVTNEMYAKCVEANQCNSPDSKRSKTRPSYFNNPEFGNYPVIYVTWDDAYAYCSWAGRRLPTEAEWEKAARGPNGYKYPWGNVDPKDTLLNYNGNVSDTSEAGRYPEGASIYGALDMAGNVWEWVNDWYDPNYYEISPATNPLGPTSEDSRVLRGGSWNPLNAAVGSIYRYAFVPTTKNDIFGFRCAISKP